MTTDLDALEALAKAATPGPWDATEGDSGPEVHAGEILRHEIDFLLREGGHDQGRSDARFIAAADPSTILALIAELRQEREWAGSLLDKAGEIAQQNRNLVEVRLALEAALSRAEETIAKARDVLRGVHQRPGSFGAAALTILNDYERQEKP